MDLNKILIGLLTKTLNKSADDIRTIIYKEGTEELNEGVLDALLAEDAIRVKGFNDKRESDIEDQRKKAKLSAYQNLESKLKATFGLTTDKTGDELIAEAKATKPAEGGEGDEITDDQIKGHSLYITLQTEKKKNEDKLNSDWQIKLDNANSTHTRQSTRQQVNVLALAKAKGLNPKLSEDPVKAQKQLSMILSEFDGLEFEADDNNSYLVKKDGKAYVDGHNNPISFDALVESATTTYFELGESGGGSGGTGTENENSFGKGKHSQVKTPADADEYKAQIREAKTTEERAAISKAWETSQSPDEEK